MSQFPETRHTLIRRLADSGGEDDWRQFLLDYWRPVCRFAARWGRLGLDDAEDVASATFTAFVEGDLLKRWLSAPQSRLRTLVCGVVRNVIANRARVASGRKRILLENRDELQALGTVRADEADDEARSHEDAFYAAWAEELLQGRLAELQAEYLRTGRGDYFRVLYGRVCDGMSNAEIAAALGLKVTDVENYAKRARQHLQQRLEQALGEHVLRYCSAGDVEEERRLEWQRLGAFFQRSGGLEQAIRSSYELSGDLLRRERASTASLLKQLGRVR